MHEYAIADGIVATSLSAIESHARGRLERVHVVVGEQNHLDPEILSEAFTMAAAGTPAEGAVLNVETATDRCTECRADPPPAATGLAVTAVDVSEAAGHSGV